METNNRPLPPTARPHVLAVDDEPLNLLVIEGALAPLGCRIVGAADARSAMAAMLASRPDLVLLDVMMPGESGIELCKKMRNTPALADVPVILVTALDAAGHRSEGLTSGADDYIEKPIDVDQLTGRVRSLLARAGSGPHETAAQPARRRVTFEEARRQGFDEPAARLIGMAAALHEAAVLSGAGEQAGALADAMARAVGLPAPSSLGRRLAGTVDCADAIDRMIGGSRP